MSRFDFFRRAAFMPAATLPERANVLFSFLCHMSSTEPSVTFRRDSFRWLAASSFQPGHRKVLPAMRPAFACPCRSAAFIFVRFAVFDMPVQDSATIFIFDPSSEAFRRSPFAEFQMLAAVFACRPQRRRQRRLPGERSSCECPPFAAPARHASSCRQRARLRGERFSAHFR